MTPPPDWAKELRRERQAIVRRLRRNGGDRARTAREMGVARSLVHELARLHNIPASDRSGRHISQQSTVGQARLAAVLEALARNRGNVKRTAREVGVPESTVRTWRDRYRERWELFAT